MYIKEVFMKTYPAQIYAGRIDATIIGKGLVWRWELPWSQVQPQKIAELQNGLLKWVRGNIWGKKN